MPAPPEKLGPRFEIGYLHIGTEKTGSSTIQLFLDKNTAYLLARGYFAPPGISELSHGKVVAFAMDDDRQDEPEMVELRSLSGGTSAFREKFVREFADQVRAAPREAKYLIISSEHFHSWLLRPSEFQRLRDFLSNYCGSLQIVVFLRRQDRVAVSLHSTRLFQGGTDDVALLPSKGSMPYYYCFHEVIRNYAAVFGAENVRARLFERERWVAGDLIADFLAACGIEDRSGMIAVPKANTSVTPAAQRFLAEMNRSWTTYDTARLPDPGYIQQLIIRQCPGRGRLVARADAEEFYRRFQAGNDWIKRNYFPNLSRPTLFDESFAEYPFDPDTEQSDFIGAVDMSLRIFAPLAFEWGRLFCVLQGKKLRARFRWQGAAESFRCAVEFAPRNADARIEHIYTLLLLRRINDARAAADSAAAAFPGHDRIMQLSGKIQEGAYWRALALPVWWKISREMTRPWRRKRPSSTE